MKKQKSQKKNKYVQWPLFKDMIPGVVYIHNANGYWEAEGKSKYGIVFGLGSEKVEEIPTLVKAVSFSVHKMDTLSS